MQGGLEIAVGSQLQQLADIDHQSPRQGRRRDPAVGCLYLKPGVIVLHHQGQVAGILVGAHSLAAAARFAPRIVDELHVLIGGTLDAGIEHSLRLRQHLGEGVEQGEGDVAQPFLPGQQLRFHLGQGGRPLVGAYQPLPGGMDLVFCQRRRLIHDVELLPPVRPLASEFGAHLVVTAKMGGVYHLHRPFFLLRQGEEAGRQRQGLLLLHLAQAMACQIEKADIAGRPAKLGQHLATSRGGATKGGEIDDRQW